MGSGVTSHKESALITAKYRCSQGGFLHMFSHSSPADLRRTHIFGALIEQSGGFLYMFTRTRVRAAISRVLRNNGLLSAKGRSISKTSAFLTPSYIIRSEKWDSFCQRPFNLEDKPLENKAGAARSKQRGRCPAARRHLLIELALYHKKRNAFLKFSRALSLCLSLFLDVFRSFIFGGRTKCEEK